jgi:hypothetical protein
LLFETLAFPFRIAIVSSPVCECEAPFSPTGYTVKPIATCFEPKTGSIIILVTFPDGGGAGNIGASPFFVIIVFYHPFPAD